ncbi:MAG: copper chaperone PCu(A)C [Candidatus Nanopelagicales bacterium]
MSKKKSVRAMGFAAGAVAVVALSGCSSDSGSSASSPSPTTPSISDAKVMEPTGDMTAMFGTISNPTSAATTLTGCSSPVARMCQIHEVIKTGNVEKMQQVPDGLEIPANGSVQLKSGSYHVMLMNLTQKVAVGDSVDVTLQFSDGSVAVTAPVVSRSASPSSGM